MASLIDLSLWDDSDCEDEEEGVDEGDIIYISDEEEEQESDEEMEEEAR